MSNNDFSNNDNTNLNFIIMLDAKEYFEEKARGDVRLIDAIPELLDVLDVLKPLRNNRLQTNRYLEDFLRSKVVNGDLNVQDDYVCWLTEYFYEQFKNKIGKTISYAYALELLIHYFNRRVVRGDIMNNIAMEQGQYLHSILFGISNKEVLNAINEESIAMTENYNMSEINKQQKTCDAKRLINNDLKRYFVISFYNGMNVHQIDYYTENLLPDLQNNFDKKTFAAIALLIKNSSQVRRSVKDMKFAAWRKLFFRLIGVQDVDYKENKLIEKIELIRNQFYYIN